MFITKNDKEVKWYWHDGKMHSVRVQLEGEDMNLKDLHDKIGKVMKDKEDLCKDIYYLGVCLTGTSEGGWGFLAGWIARSEKKDQTWQIIHTDEEVPEEQVKEHLAETLETYAKFLREDKGDDTSVKGASTPTFGGTSGTELFGS